MTSQKRRLVICKHTQYARREMQTPYLTRLYIHTHQLNDTKKIITDIQDVSLYIYKSYFNVITINVTTLYY